MPRYRVAVTVQGRCEIDVFAKDARSAEDEVFRISINQLTDKCEFGNGLVVDSVEEIPINHGHLLPVEWDLD